MIPVYLGKIVFGKDEKIELVPDTEGQWNVLKPGEKGSNMPPEVPDNGLYGIDPYQTPDKTPVKR